MGLRGDKMNRQKRRATTKALIKLGIKVFAVREGMKTPVAKGWQKEAERTDLKQWSNGADHNIGVMCGGDLVVVDIDMKNGVDGEKNWKALCNTLGIKESQFQIATPSGGRHIYYSTPDGTKIRNSVSEIAKGVDIRGDGGYVVGPNSSIIEGEYTVINKGASIMKAPLALIELLTKKKGPTVGEVSIAGEDVDSEENLKRADEYLDIADPSVEGDGGDQRAFAVAARVRDMGVSEEECLERMLGDWNGRCSPPWSGDELAVKVENAYRYASGGLGSDTPEAQFADDPDSGPYTKAPARRLSEVEKFNERFAFVAVGTSHVITEEYLDEEDNRLKLALYGERSFHGMYASKVWFDADGGKHIVSKEWYHNPDRLSYRGFTFDPRKVGPVGGKFNHWRGFSIPTVEGMSEAEAKKACDLFLKHIKNVICCGNMSHYKWILNHFAHLVQYPDKKPETAIVVRGEKGAGKSLIFDVMGKLVKDNYILTAEKRMLLGNFNSHMETVLLFQFEEAFWAGDKQAEGKLKLLITSKLHMIERKGYEPYMVGNYARIYITSNNDWVVPATVDERRFAIFECLNTRVNDKAYFKALFDQLEANDGAGYRALMTLLSKMKVDKLEVHRPPQTDALAEQKIESMDQASKWLFTALQDGSIEGVGTGFEKQGTWQKEVPTREIYEDYVLFLKSAGFHYPKSDRAFGRLFNQMLGEAVSKSRVRTGHKGTELHNVYKLGELKKCRNEFEKWFKQEIKWDVHV